MRFLIAALVTTSLAIAAGCSVAPAGDDEQVVATAGSELTLPSVQVVGALKNGESRKFPYVPSALRAYTIDAKGGDQITFDVKSTVGNPIAYITDKNNVVLAASEGTVTGGPGGPDASPPSDGPVLDGSDRNADLGAGEGEGEEIDRASITAASVSVKFKLPANSPAGAYRVVFKNKDVREVLFTLKVSVLTGAAVCTFQGSQYGVGSNYAAKDECNTCSCKADGSSQCSTFTCVCGNEPWRDYEFTSQDKCLGWHAQCPSGTFAFANSCGCGCEKPH